MSEPVTIKLRRPIEAGPVTLTELTIRPPKAKDLRRIKSSDSNMVTTLNMASWLTGQLAIVIDELEGEDLAEVLAVVDRFFIAIHWTGGKSSEP